MVVTPQPQTKEQEFLPECLYTRVCLCTLMHALNLSSLTRSYKSLFTILPDFGFADGPNSRETGGIDIDNVRLTVVPEVPEPVTGGLLACELALMLTCWRRKRQ